MMGLPERVFTFIVRWCLGVLSFCLNTTMCVVEVEGCDLGSLLLLLGVVGFLLKKATMTAIISARLL